MKIRITLFLSLCGLWSAAQQLPISSLYDMHGIMHNPATVGVNKYASIGADFRTQWSSMPGSPTTGMLFGNTSARNGLYGIGGYVYKDVTGPTNRTGVQPEVAYIIRMKDESSFSLGISFDLQQFAYEKDKLQVPLGNDPVIAGKDTRFKFDAGFGVAYTTKKFQVGAAVAQLLQSKLDLYQGTGTTNVQSQQYRHFYFHGKYDFNVDEMTHIIPNFLVVYLPNAPTEFQGGIRVEHNNLFWYGLSLRAHQSWMLSAGLKIMNKFNIGYSFDLYSTPLSVYDGGANGHEIMLRYDFMK